MQIIKLWVVSCIFLFSSCSLIPHSNISQSESAAFHIDQKSLNAGTLLIQLPSEKPECLSIQTPGGEWFVLQDKDAAIEIMPQAVFDATDKFSFNIRDLKGTTWRESEKVTEIIFKDSGRYRIYFADNLETEPENTYSLQGDVYFTAP